MRTSLNLWILKFISISIFFLLYSFCFLIFHLASSSFFPLPCNFNVFLPLFFSFSHKFLTLFSFLPSVHNRALWAYYIRQWLDIINYAFFLFVHVSSSFLRLFWNIYPCKLIFNEIYKYLCYLCTNFFFCSS